MIPLVQISSTIKLVSIFKLLHITSLVKVACSSCEYLAVSHFMIYLPRRARYIHVAKKLHMWTMMLYLGNWFFATYCDSTILTTICLGTAIVYSAFTHYQWCIHKIKRSNAPMLEQWYCLYLSQRKNWYVHLSPPPWSFTVSWWLIFGLIFLIPAVFFCSFLNARGCLAPPFFHLKLSTSMVPKPRTAPGSY